MKVQLQHLIEQACQHLQADDDSSGTLPVVQVERTRDREHGDFASNVALMLAKPLKKNPREIAESIKSHLPESDLVTRVEIAGPGFINFYLSESAFYQAISEVLGDPSAYGRLTLGNGVKILLEFVSANPTGPLHVGHGRGAAYGACLADLLEMVGFEVLREYYVNDAGRQMDILAASVWWRYIEEHADDLPFPSNGYRGEYIKDISAHLSEQYNDRFKQPADLILKDLPLDEEAGGDKEVYIDAVIAKSKALLGNDDYQLIHQFALDNILKGIKEDLDTFGVSFDEWYRESSLMDSQAVHQSIEVLKKSGGVYEKEGAQWFNSTKYDDEKDRVLVRANGQFTYFASDVAYHMDKFSRGYHRLIDVLGSDHHGYVARIRAVITAMGGDPDNFSVQLVQFANLFRGKERIQMSTRSGSFVTLKELVDEIGKDAARFFYVMRKVEQHMDFDLELAKSQSNENPVYYIQYAHARICSILRQLKEKNLSIDRAEGLRAMTQLTSPQEIMLVTDIARYPEIIESAAKAYEPHQVAHYLRDLANNFHSYYNAQQILVEQADVRNARVCLIEAVQQVIVNALALLGVSAP